MAWGRPRCAAGGAPGPGEACRARREFATRCSCGRQWRGWRARWFFVAGSDRRRTKHALGRVCAGAARQHPVSPQKSPAPPFRQHIPAPRSPLNTSAHPQLPHTPRAGHASPKSSAKPQARAAEQPRGCYGPPQRCGRLAGALGGPAGQAPRAAGAWAAGAPRWPPPPAAAMLGRRQGRGRGGGGRVCLPAAMMDYRTPGPVAPPAGPASSPGGAWHLFYRPCTRAAGSRRCGVPLAAPLGPALVRVDPLAPLPLRLSFLQGRFGTARRARLVSAPAAAASPAPSHPPGRCCPASPPCRTF